MTTQTIEALRAGVTGAGGHPRGPWLRRGPEGLQLHDRPPPGGGRALRERGRRGRRRAACGGDRHGARRPGRRAQRPRLRHGRRRAGRRSVRPLHGDRGPGRPDRHAPAAASPGAASTTPPVRTGWRRPAGSSPRPGSAGSPSAAGSAISLAATACPATTCSRPRSSPPTGSIVTASETEHPDLFWALRGGGGNFGVVTEFTFRVHPVAEIYGGPMFFELSDGPALLAYFNEFIKTAPREYGGFPAFQIAPPLPFVPGGPGRGAVRRAGVLLDRVARRRARRSCRGSGTSRTRSPSTSGRCRTPALNSAFDALVPRGLQHYWKAEFVGDLTRRGDQGAHGARPARAGGQLHGAPLPDQRRLPRRGAGRDGVRAPRRDVRDRDRGHVAGPGRQRGQHPVGEGLRRGDRSATRRAAATSTSPPPTTSPRWRRTTAPTTPGCRRSSVATTRATCSTSTRTSSRKGLSQGPAPGVVEAAGAGAPAASAVRCVSRSVPWSSARAAGPAGPALGSRACRCLP